MRHRILEVVDLRRHRFVEAAAVHVVDLHRVARAQLLREADRQLIVVRRLVEVIQHGERGRDLLVLVVLERQPVEGVAEARVDDGDADELVTPFCDIRIVSPRVFIDESN